MSSKLKLGITIGDHNGVGPELVVRTLANPLVHNYCVPVVYGNAFILNHCTKTLDLPKLNLHILKKGDEPKEGVVNLSVCSDARVNIEFGQPTEDSAAFALASLEAAVQGIKSGQVENLLTAPIDKHTIQKAGLNFNGHTGYLADAFESDALMLLLDDDLRVAMVTGHTALENVVSELSQEKIHTAISSFHHSLVNDFGIQKPKIAVLGLNPHSGDRGLMGNQEAELIAPAIQQALDEDILVVGPFPPDTFFGTQHARMYDGVLGMYHDQVLIPFKQLAFSSGVNYTAGLPIVRTSPDHGTAYDIAGKGIADLSSFVNAMYLINKIYRNRIENYGQLGKFLKFREHRREKFSIGVPDLK